MSEGGGGCAAAPGQPIDPRTEREAALVLEMKKVLALTEDTWDGIIAQTGARYRQPQLVLFRSATPSACGTGHSAVGPVDCPGEQQIRLRRSCPSA